MVKDKKATEKANNTPDVENLDETFDMGDSKHFTVLDYEEDKRRNVLDDFLSDSSSDHGDLEANAKHVTQQEQQPREVSTQDNSPMDFKKAANLN